MSRGRITCILIGMLILVASTGRAAAQPGPSDLINQLRAKPELTADDVAALDDFIESIIKAFESEHTDLKAPGRFQERMAALYGHPENSPRFAQRVAERSALRMAARFKDANGRIGLAMLYALAAMPETGTLLALREAVSSRDEAVRALALKTLLNLRSKLEAEPALVSDVIRWLQEAGGRETSSLVLGRIYQAIDFGSKQDEQAGAITTILEARLQNYHSGPVSAEKAELAAYQRLAALSSALNDAEKKRLVGVLAKYLTYHTHRYLYLDLGEEARGNLHRLIFLAERLLTTLTGLSGDPGGVAGALASAGAERAAKIRSALEFWIGSKDKPGQLNAGSWQLPVGAGTNLDFAAPLPQHLDELLP